MVASGWAHELLTENKPDPVSGQRSPETEFPRHHQDHHQPPTQHKRNIKVWQARQKGGELYREPGVWAGPEWPTRDVMTALRARPATGDCLASSRLKAVWSEGEGAKGSDATAPLLDPPQSGWWGIRSRMNWVCQRIGQLQASKRNKVPCIIRKHSERGAVLW